MEICLVHSSYHEGFKHSFLSFLSFLPPLYRKASPDIAEIHILTSQVITAASCSRGPPGKPQVTGGGLGTPRLINHVVTT